MLQTRRHAARLLQRPYNFQLRGYADSGPTDPSRESKLANPPSTGSDSSDTPSAHAASAGRHEPRDHNSYPIPENESIGRGVYVALAVLFGSFAVYKFSHSNSDPASAGDSSKQPLITRLLHSFDYLKEQNEIRNTLYTQAMVQIGHDRNLFEGTPPTQYVEPRISDVAFNSGSPWNVPAGSTVDLEHVRRHYQNQNAKMEIERAERRERMARYAERYNETGQVKEAFGEVINAVSSVGNKASKKD